MRPLQTCRKYRILTEYCSKQIIVQQGRGMPRPRFYGYDNITVSP